MRIAYITINIAPEIINGGVGRKIKSQTSTWRSMGHDVELFVLTPDLVSLPDAKQFVFKRSTRLFPFGILQREVSRSKTLIRMLAEIRGYGPEIIYFRFGLYTFPIHDLFRIAPVVMEINSNDRDEYRSRGVFFYWLNRVTRDLLFSRCAGWIASSHELAGLEENRRHRKPALVVSNGIELEKYVPLPPPRNKLPALTLVGSPGMNWHGVDKLFAFAERYQELSIHIIGYRQEDFNISMPANIHLHGYLEQPELRSILAVSDVVFGTLALHRKKMEEASPLKVREALAYGIPVVIAYRDTDLNELDLDTILHIPNTEDNVMQNGERIRKFAYAMIGKRVDLASIGPLLDSQPKEQSRLAFFQKILDGRKA